MRYSRFTVPLKLLDMSCLGTASRQASGKQPVVVGAVVSNHIGWADILVHMSHYFPSFVAREETASLAFIGVCWCAAQGLAFRELGIAARAALGHCQASAKTNQYRGGRLLQ